MATIILDQVVNQVVIPHHQLISQVSSLQNSLHVHPHNLVEIRLINHLANLIDIQLVNHRKYLKENLANNLLETPLCSHQGSHVDILQTNRLRFRRFNQVGSQNVSLRINQLSILEINLQLNQLAPHLNSHFSSHVVVPPNTLQYSHHSSLGDGQQHSLLGYRLRFQQGEYGFN